MSNDKKPGLVPKLRFPEFEGVWKDQPLGEIAAPVTARVGHTIVTPLSITSGVGLIPQQEKFGRIIAGEQYKNYFCLEPGDFAYNKSATKAYPQGFIARYSSEEPGAVPNSIFYCFRPDRNKVDGHFLNYLFINNLHGRWLARLNSVGARAHGSLNVDNADILQIPVPIPVHRRGFAEQRKIAECLSSLDEVISAETCKLEALKRQKKGLLQQLFPAAGESTPRLRFPEFHYAGEWRDVRLSELGSLVAGLTFTPKDVKNAGVLVLRSSNIRDGEIALEDRVYVDKTLAFNRARANDILICVRNGSRQLIGKNALIPPGMPLCTPGAFMTIFRARWPLFVRYLFETDRYEHQVAADLGATINSINGSNLLKYSFCVPEKNEAEAICSVLFPLDQAISIGKVMLTQLRQHKRGLMQQLFPSLEAPAS